MKKYVVIVLATLFFPQAAPSKNTTGDALNESIQIALQSKRFADAVQLIDTELTTAKRQRDYLLYLKGLALFNNGDYRNAIGTCGQLMQKHADSTWLKKATFLQAQCHLKLKEFEQAEAIYGNAVSSLLSSRRKSEIAQIYIDLAETLARKPNDTDLDAPPPNYQKAYELYQKILTLEIDDDLRKTSAFQLGRMMQLQEDFRQAVADYEAYLTQFDPDFQRPAALAKPSKKGNTPESRRYTARFHLAECRIAMNQHQLARLTLEDLLKLVDVEMKERLPLIKDARFLLTRTYHFPAPRSDAELELGVQSARAFQELFPRDRRSMTLAYDIAEAYRARGRSEDALAAYQEFIDKKGFKVRQEKRENSIPNNQDYHYLRTSAMFQIGATLFDQRKYTLAIEAWNRYIREFPNGRQWTDAQQGIVNAEYQIGAALLAGEDYEEAVNAFDEFQAKYPLDSRVGQIMFIYGQIHYHKSEHQQAIAEWEKVVVKYPNTEESSLALFRIGQTYELRLGNLEKALESYRKLTWGSWHVRAQEVIRQMTEKHLKLVTSRTFRTNETAHVKVSLRNIESLTVNLYKLNLEAYWRKMYDVKGVEDLDLGLINPNKTWQYDVPDYEKYKPFECDIDIPFDGAGVYAVQVGDESLESTTLLVRSDIETITKTSRREVLVLVQNLLNGEVVADAKVLVSNGSSIIFEGRTGADGVLHATERAISDSALGANQLKDANRAATFVVKDGHAAADGLDISGLGFSKGLTPRGYIYTDRPAYRPGETVSMCGIIRDVSKGSYVVPDGAIYNVSVIDARGRQIHIEAVRLSQFGGFDTQMKLDEAAAAGEYRIRAALYDSDRKLEIESHTFTGSFQVQRFQLERVRLLLEFPRPVYFRGEQVEAEFFARYYYGQPVKNAIIQYKLPDGRSYTETADNQGKLKVNFDTALMQPGKLLHFSGTVLGENAIVRSSVMLAHLGYSISVQPDASLVLSGEPFDVTFQTEGADGQPVGEKLTVKVIQKQSSGLDSPVVSQIPWIDNQNVSRSAEIIIQEHSLQTDSQTGTGTIQLTLNTGGVFRIRASGTDRFGQAVVGSRNITISDDRDKTKLRIFSERTKTQVGATERLRIHSRLKPVHTLITYEGEVIIGYEVRLLKPGMNPLEVTVGHEHFPDFYIGVAAIDDRILRTARKRFTVERQLNLSVTWLGSDPIRGADQTLPGYLPGEVAEIQVRATDQLGQPVKAEFSLALVDEALFAVYKDSYIHINDYFQKGLRRKAAMRTASSCTFEYMPITRRVVQEILDEKRRLIIEAEAFSQHDLDSGATTESSVLRKRRLRPTIRNSVGRQRRAVAANYDKPQVREESTYAGYWIGVATTNDAGLATVTVPMPEKMTKWRLTGRGSTIDTLVGQVTVNAMTRQNFFLDVRTPSIVTEGDDIRVAVQLHNRTDYEGDAEVQLKLSVDGSETAHGDHKRTTISANDSTELIFDSFSVPAGSFYTGLNQSKLTVEVTANAGALGDGLRRQVPIRPWGLEHMDTRSGTATDDRTVYVELPSAQRYTRKGMTINIGPSVTRLIYELALNHRPRPFQSGSIRRSVMMPSDVGSDLLAAASALRYQEKVGGNPSDNRRLLNRARTLVNRLVTTQNEDGGWNLIGGTAGSNPRVTARNLWALTTTRDSGAAVDDQSIVNAANYLKAAFLQINHENENLTKAFSLHALSTVGEVDFADANRLYRRRNQLGDAALAYAALVFFNLNRLNTASEMLDILERRGLLPDEEENARIDSSFTGQGQVETVALALLSMQAVRPNSAWVKDAVEYLIGQRRYYGYSPYSAKGAAAAALSAYYQETQFAADDYRLNLLVNGKPLETISVQKDSVNRLIHVPATQIRDGKNRVEMQIEGQGTYTYLVTINGFSPDMPNWAGAEPKTEVSLKNTRIHRRYLHPPLEYQGNPIGAQSTTEMTQLEAGAKMAVKVNIANGIGALSPNQRVKGRHFVVDEYFPAGTTVVEGTVEGDFHHYDLGDGVIRFYYGPEAAFTGYGYQLVGYAPGEYRVLPTVIRDVQTPDYMRLGPSGSLTVLGPGEKSDSAYEMNDAEKFALGKAYFDDNTYGDARPLLEALLKGSPNYNAKETAKMLLWIYTTEDYYAARKVIQAFEDCHDLDPDFHVPFDKIQVVSSAYRDIEEFERATMVHRSAIESSFANDASVSATLEDQGEFLRSIDFIESLWREYPDTATTVPAYFAIAQPLYASKDDEDGKVKTASKSHLLDRTVDILSQFLTLYPMNPLADDAAFSLANALMDLEDFQSVVHLCELNQTYRPDSPLLSSFQYMEALGRFALSEYGEAIKAATLVASSESEDRDFARYIIGQIYHAQGNPEQAIHWYNTVRTVYPDAEESIAHLEAQRITLPDVTIERPNKDVVLRLKYRNIKSAEMQVYRIDLMNLFLREKDLSGVTQVHLAGIEPEASQTVEFGDGKDYIEITRDIALPITEDGAYLVTCRGGKLFASGLILITPLAIEVQEGAVSGRVRVVVRDAVTGKYLPRVHVKAVGSADGRFVSGETDFRGIFIADGLHGATTVIARGGMNRYAFHRSNLWLGAPASESESRLSPKAATDYRLYLERKNQEIQAANLERFDRLRREPRRGVQLQHAY